MTITNSSPQKLEEPNEPRAEQPFTSSGELHLGHNPTLALFHLQDAGPPLHEAVAICSVLRSALQRKFDRKQTGARSPIFSGHAENGHRQDQHRHAHYLALPDPGGPRIDRLVVWAPEGFGPEEVASLAALRKLWMREAGDPLPVALAALGDEWQLRLDAIIGPAERWHTITPFALPRHPKWRSGTIVDDAADQIRRELAFRDVGLADCLTDVIEQPSERWLRFRRTRPGSSHRQAPPVAGVELRFASPVRGPIALGALSHFGLGLFTPARD